MATEKATRPTVTVSIDRAAEGTRDRSIEYIAWVGPNGDWLRRPLQPEERAGVGTIRRLVADVVPPFSRTLGHVRGLLGAGAAPLPELRWGLPPEWLLLAWPRGDWLAEGPDVDDPFQRRLYVVRFSRQASGAGWEWGIPGTSWTDHMGSSAHWCFVRLDPHGARVPWPSSGSGFLVVPGAGEAWGVWPRGKLRELMIEWLIKKELKKRADSFRGAWPWGS